MPSLYIIIAAIALSFSLGFGGGYKTKSLFIDAAMVKQLKTERQMRIETIAYNKELVSLLDKKEVEIQVETKYITKEIIKYVPTIQKTDSVCNITNDSKRLLNSLISGASETSTGITDTDTGPSDIRTSDLIEYVSISVREYKIMQARCNALIQFNKAHQ